MLATGCIDKPVAPNWDVVANAPIVNKSYTLLDVVSKDSLHLITPTSNNSLGQLYYTQDTAIKPIFVGSQLKLNPISTNSTVALGAIKINNPAPVSANISSTQINSLFVGGSTLAGVPAFAKNDLVQSMPTITSFSTATFASGSMSLSIKNHLGNNLSITVGQVRILDGSNNTLVSSSQALTLQYDQTGVITIDLANKTLVSDMKIEVNISSTGSTQSVIIPTDAALNITAQFVSLDPQTVTAVVPQQDPKSFNGSFPIDNDPNSAISKIVISKGVLHFSIKNNFKVPLTIKINLTSLITPNGVFTYTAKINGNSTATVDTNIAGWTINPNTLTSSIDYNGTATVLATSSPVQLAKTDNVAVTVNMDELTLTSLTGKIKTTALTPSYKTIQVSLGNLKNFNATTINFKNFGLTVPVGASPSLKLGFSGTITGYNKTTQGTISIPLTTLPGNGVIQKLTFDQTQLDNFINKFYNTPPDSLRIDYAPVINPNPQATDAPGQITSQDSVFGKVSIYTPLNVGVAGGKLTDTVLININNSNKTQLDQIGSVTVNLVVSNGVPAKVLFSGTLYDEFGHYMMPFPPVHAPNPTEVLIPAATVDTSGFSNPNKPGTTTITLQLTGTEMQNFINSKKMIMVLKIDTALPSASPVSFRSIDAISVKASGSINYTVKP